MRRTYWALFINETSLHATENWVGQKSPCGFFSKLPKGGLYRSKCFLHRIALLLASVFTCLRERPTPHSFSVSSWHLGHSAQVHSGCLLSAAFSHSCLLRVQVVLPLFFFILWNCGGGFRFLSRIKQTFSHFFRWEAIYVWDLWQIFHSKEFSSDPHQDPSVKFPSYFSPMEFSSSPGIQQGDIHYLRSVRVSHSVMSDSLWPPMDYRSPGSSVHGILQARILEWVAISFSRGSSWPKDRTWVSCIAGWFFTIWAIGKSQPV